MVELNFGPSEYAIYSSRIEPDMILNIPEHGQFPEIPASFFEEFLTAESKATLSSLEPRNTKRSFPSVEFQLKKDDRSYNYEYDYENKMILLWLDERKEWVALHYRKWLESMPKKDEKYEGPFRLGKHCQEKIREAYKIPEGNIDLESICRTSPDDLAKISGGLK